MDPSDKVVAAAVALLPILCSLEDRPEVSAIAISAAAELITRESAGCASRVAAARTLSQLALKGDDSTGVLLRNLLSSSESAARAAAVKSLGHVCGRDAVADLKAFASDDAPSVRMAVAAALGAAGGSEAISTLLQMLESDESCLVRERAARAIGKAAESAGAIRTTARTSSGLEIWQEEATDALLAALETDDYAVQVCRI